MRRFAPSILFIILLFSATAWAQRDQQQQVISIRELKEQIAKLEVIERDPATTEEAKALNRSFLAERRTRLRAQLEARRDGLQKYLATAGTALSQDERVRVESSIRSIEIDLENLNRESGSTRPLVAALNPATSASGSSVSNQQPAVASSVAFASPAVSDSLPSRDRLVRARLAQDTPPGVEITLPSTDPTRVNQSPTNLYIKVDDAKKSVKELYVIATDDAGRVVQQQTVKVDYNAKDGIQKTKIKVVKDKNTIKVIPQNEKGERVTPADVTKTERTVYCEGDDCGKSTDATTAAAKEEPLSGLYARSILGFEQVGASAADSESKPFVNFFINTPVWFSHRSGIPIFSLWGDIRLTAVPQQVSTLGTFPSNFAGSLTGGKLVDLVQGFEFLAGGEGMILKTDITENVPFLNKQTAVMLTASYGAISPLSTRKNSALILTVPSATSPQRALFVERYGDPAAAKKYIAFVFPDRDRFLREWYLGFRFKTFGLNEKQEFINSPPAMLDVQFGQNEAVTGGRFHAQTLDENGNLIKGKRQFVVRLEAFYPFYNNKLYLYGSAIMKVKGGGVNISTPLFLDTAPGNVTITSDDVFISPTLQTNRDVYRIGVGVDLIKLFNPEKPKETAAQP